MAKLLSMENMISDAKDNKLLISFYGGQEGSRRASPLSFPSKKICNSLSLLDVLLIAKLIAFAIIFFQINYKTLIVTTASLFQVDPPCKVFLQKYTYLHFLFKKKKKREDFHLQTPSTIKLSYNMPNQIQNKQISNHNKQFIKKGKCLT